MDPKREPVALLAAVRAVITIVAALGLVTLTEAETETIVTAAGAIYLAAEVVITVFQRARVTPVAAPRLPRDK